MKYILTSVVICALGSQLQAQISFTLSSSPSVGNVPVSVTSADINGDGKPDLIGANQNDNTLSVLTNNGSGGFVTSGAYAVGANPLDVVTADVNGDGKLDLICANHNNSTLSILTNTGTGRFVLSSSPGVGSGTWSVVAADVNDDGKADLICANDADADLSVLTNNGSGGFVLSSSPGVGAAPVSVTTADVNGDNKVDLICANSSGNTLSVLTNNGSGSFVASGTYAVGSKPFSVATADVNGDNKVDLICANFNDNTLSVLTNNGSGSFVLSSSPGVGSGAFYVTAKDVNGDGGVDLICANFNGNTLSVLTNNGSGGFVLAASPGTGSLPRSIVAADINGDGKVDLITANGGANTLSVLTNATPFPQSPCDSAPSGLVSWWPGEGNANDIISGNNGTLINGTGFASGKVGNAFSFNNSGIQSVNIPRSAGLSLTNQVTIEFWMKADPANSMNSFQGLVTSDNYLISIDVGNPNLGVFGVDFAINDQGIFYQTANANGGGVHVSAGVWHHIAGTYDGTKLQLYVDGQPSGNPKLHTGGISPMPLSGLLSIGSEDGRISCGCTGRHFWGLIDEASIYSRALSAAEIAAIYNAGSSGKCPPPPPPPPCDPAPSGLVSWWPGEGNANDVVSLNNGVAQNITYAGGEVESAFYLNGSNAFVAVPASSSLNVGAGQGFTFETWINPASLKTQAVAEWNNNAGSLGAHLWLSVGPFGPGPAGCLYANLRDTGGGDHILSTGGGVIVPNSFQHVALTYNKATGMAVLYLNGTPVQTSSLGVFTPQTTYNFYLGTRPSGAFAGSYFGGTMDEPGLYNRALSAAEIAAIYNAGSSGKCPPAPAPPVITTQPTNQTVTVGSTATFSVTASSTVPLSYQWSFNTTNILGATNAMLTLNNVQFTQAGNYAVLVANTYDSILSSNAVLTVNIPPVADATATIPLVISVNNSNATVVLDGSLSYDLDGDSLQYFWYQTGASNSLATGVVAVVVLPVGTNSITLLVNDGLASSQQTITVEVITLAQAVERLEAVVIAGDSQKQSLIALLNAALASIDRSNPTAAINQLQAFQNQVNAQISPLDPTLAQTLIDTAQSIINALSGGGASSHKAIKATAQANGKIHLNFSGTYQQTYIIEASTNLVDWEMIGVANDNGDGTFDFDDADAKQMPGRFYRVVAP